MLFRINTNQLQLSERIGDERLTLHGEASELQLPLDHIRHTIELQSQRTGVVIELGLDMGDVVQQEQEYGEVRVFQYSNKANGIRVTIFND